MKKSPYKIRNKEGFTLLELLVVVAILAAIAGTATIALKDTDARASAAAHVAMMDELNKGIRTYRILKKNTLPTRFDSLLNASYEDPGCLGFAIDEEAVEIAVIPTDVADICSDGGLESLMYINDSWTDSDSGATADADGIQDIIDSRANAIVAGNVFMTTDSGSGCGLEESITNGTASAVFWADDSERLTGAPMTAANYYDAGEPAFMLTGIGPSSSLFDTTELGGMTTVPVYRHVAANEYGRFIAVWKVGEWNGTAPASGTADIVNSEQLELITILDGALDTKEEELGEWDGTRNTI